jgi:hypothetical protein
VTSTRTPLLIVKRPLRTLLSLSLSLSLIARKSDRCCKCGERGGRQDGEGSVGKWNGGGGGGGGALHLFVHYCDFRYEVLVAARTRRLVLDGIVGDTVDRVTAIC